MGKNLFTLPGKGKPGGRMDSSAQPSQGVRGVSDQRVGLTTEGGLPLFILAPRIRTIAFSRPCLLPGARHPLDGRTYFGTLHAPSALSVHFYRNAAGKEPVRSWLIEELSPGARKAIGADIKTVQLGWPIGMPVVRKMTPGLWEIRSRIPEGIARVLFTIVDTRMVLLHGFVKKTQATPGTDIELALHRMKEAHK